MRALLKKLFINGDYGLLFMGRLVSQIGDGVHYFAITWLILDLTSSGTALVLYSYSRPFPASCLHPLLGVLADMWDRKKIVVITDIIRGLILLQSPRFTQRAISPQCDLRRYSPFIDLQACSLGPPFLRPFQGW